MLQLVRQLMPEQMALRTCSQSAARLLIANLSQIKKPRWATGVAFFGPTDPFLASARTLSSTRMSTLSAQSWI